MPLRALIASCLPIALMACVAPGSDAASVSDAAPGEASGAGSIAIFPALDADAGPAKNVWFSPLSSDYAFSIVALGARGETADQLAATLPPLRSPGDYQRDRDGVEVRLASRLWVDEEFSIAPSFASLADRRYDAGAETIDKDDQQGSARVINAWADKQTSGLIPEVVSPAEITEDLALFITNAIYFDGDWETELSGKGMKPFLFGDGAERPFYMMGERMDLPLVERRGWRAVRLPYADDRFVMDIIMPERREVMDSAPDLEAIEDFSRRLGEAEPVLVDMELPRFEVETDFDLIAPLKGLGLVLPFQPGQADLSGMISTGSRNLHVGGAKQLAKLQVFETGTRAAAVTVVKIVLTGGRYDPRTAKEFKVDRPFIVAIRDLENDTVLFFGRISNPQAYDPEEAEEG